MGAIAILIVDRGLRGGFGLGFMAGAGLAFLSWQTFLAGSGALARRYLPPGIQVYASVLGNPIVIALGLSILIELFS